IASSTRAVWGPWNEPLSPLTYLFAAERVSTGQYKFVLRGRPKEMGDEAFVDILAGETQNNAEGDSRRGGLGIDLDAAHALDAGEHPYLGRIAITWAIDTDQQRTVNAGLENVGDSRETKPTASALYKYMEQKGGAGNLAFGFRGDLDDRTS